MSKPRLTLIVVALLVPAIDFAAEPPAPSPADVDAVRAVMYEFTYNDKTMLITHAQVIGGFPTVDACRAAQPRVMAAGTEQLEPDERIQLECSGIREQPEAPPAQPQPYSPI